MHRLAAWISTVAALILFAAPSIAQEVEVKGPEVILSGIPFDLTLSTPGSLVPVEVAVRMANGTELGVVTVPPLESVMLGREVVVTDAAQLPLSVMVEEEVRAEFSKRIFPGWLSLLPPLLAILLALIFREVITSLLAGVWLGCLFLCGFNPLSALFMAVNRFVRGELTDEGHASIVIFTLLLGGMVGVISRVGGTRAMVDSVTPLATTPRRGQIASWLAGLAVFFDDYANSLIVGNTMRPLTDRLKISREKLAYIVDSTAAPVAAVFFVSTWIGYEVGLISDGLKVAAQQQAGDPALAAELAGASAFAVFLQTIPHLFYPLLAILTVVLVAVMGRDFGPMLKAERRARKGDGLFRPGAQLAADMTTELSEVAGAPRGRWWNGALPVLVLVVTVLTGLVVTGNAELPADEPFSLREVFGKADPYTPLMWGSVLACLTALVLAVSQRIMTMSEGIKAWMAGMRSMLLAIVILLLAWSLGEVTQSLETASFLANTLSETLPPQVLPLTVFVVASLIAFATGTSWATMAILLPLVVPLSIQMGGGIEGLTAANQAVVFGSIGSVLAGAIMGDHCSPISDTTVLSSTASSCDHVDHVRTQLPYAILVGVVAALVGSVPSALGVPAWACLLVGAAVIFGFLRLIGKRTDEVQA